MTSMRWSLPGMYSWTSTEPYRPARLYAAATWSASVRRTLAPRPRLPLFGLTATGKPIRSAASTASSALRTTFCGTTGRPTRRSTRFASALFWASLRLMLLV